VAAAVTVVLWASAFVAIRSAGAHLAPGALAFGRLLTASLALGALWLIRGGGWPPRRAWPGILGSGVLWFGLYMITLNWGERQVDAGTAAMLVNIGPILIALLGGWLLREGFPRRLGAGMVVSLAGVIVVGISESGAGQSGGGQSGGGRSPVAGIVLCVLAAICYAAGVVCQKAALRHASAVQMTTFGCFGLPAVRRAAGVPAGFGPGERHAERRLPGPVPDHARLHHLGLRARADHLGEDGRHHLRRPRPGRGHVLAHPRSGTGVAHHRRRSPLPRRRRRIPLPARRSRTAGRRGRPLA
jgi:drug/metabolite transporter (DMT)-like permease